MLQGSYLALVVLSIELIRHHLGGRKALSKFSGQCVVRIHPVEEKECAGCRLNDIASSECGIVARDGLHSTTSADVSDRSIHGSVFRVKFEHRARKRRNVGRCWLMVGWKRCGPGEARIGCQRRWDGWIRGGHKAMHS